MVDFATYLLNQLYIEYQQGFSSFFFELTSAYLWLNISQDFHPLF
jgi:hypothetical protein